MPLDDDNGGYYSRRRMVENDVSEFASEKKSNIIFRLLLHGELLIDSSMSSTNLLMIRYLFMDRITKFLV